MIKTKSKILLVHNYYQIPGGEDSVVKNEKKLLEDNGHEVILYSRNNSELKTLSKLQKLMLPITTVFNPKTYKDIKKIIKEQKVNILHVHNTLSLLSPSVYYAAFSCSVPVVQTVHNFRLLCPAATFYRDGHICEDCVTNGLKCAVKYNCYRGSRLQTMACVGSTWIHRMVGTYKKLNYICLTEFNKEKLLSMKGINKERIFVKPNFTFSNSVNVSGKTLHRNYYIYVGRLDELKGIKILFDAWKCMGEMAVKLVVCGIGPLEEWCKIFLEKNPECNIEMRGFVANTEVKELIANSKALILPTQWYEGFPMTILEAYSVGTPVIGSDLGNVGSVIIEGVTGWKFTHDSVNSLMRAVNAANKSDLVVNKSQIEQYSLENNYHQLIEIYEKASVM